MERIVQYLCEWLVAGQEEVKKRQRGSSVDSLCFVTLGTGLRQPGEAPVMININSIGGS